MEVRVDLDRCEANGVCVGIAPDIFDLDDNEELVISSVRPPEDRWEMSVPRSLSARARH